jgi:S1-C subfamily serine protease
MRRTLVIVFAVAVAGGLAGALIGVALDGGGSDTRTDQPAQTVLSPEPAASRPQTRRGLAPEAIYNRDAPAVVVITATQTQEVPPTFFSPPTKRRVESLGSGFVIDSRGDIVTNDHVVQGATGIRVGFSSGASYPATVIGVDASTDVAVVRVKAPASALHPLAFDGSTGIEVGDPAYAIGNPFGLDRTMTAGIVSAIGRDIQAPNGLTIPNAIQTDAPINHGNSGGPLLDRFGRVIGINAQIQGGTVDANVGVGFAIPGGTAKRVAEQLIARGHADHAWLGVQVETIDPSVAKVVRGLPSHGVVVARVVKGSPAAKSGLEAATRQVTVNGVGALLGGDVIVAVDGRPVTSSAQLAEAVAVRKPGDRLMLEVVRRGASRKVLVTLGDVPTPT